MPYTKFWSTLVILLSIGAATLQANPIVDKCRSEIDLITQQIHGGYTKNLKKMQQEFQLAGNLDGFLAVKQELERFEKEKILTEDHLINEQRSITWVQLYSQRNLLRMTYQIAKKYVTILENDMVKLTKENRIDEAMVVRQSIAVIRAQYEPAFDFFEEKKADSKATYSKTLGSFIIKDEDFALKILKGRKLDLYGEVTEFGPGFSDSSVFNIKLETGTERMLDFQFPNNQYRWRRVSGAEQETYLLTQKANPNVSLRVTSGQTLELNGFFVGTHINFALEKCTFPVESDYNTPHLVTKEEEKADADEDKGDKK